MRLWEGSPKFPRFHHVVWLGQVAVAASEKPGQSHGQNEVVTATLGSRVPANTLHACLATDPRGNHRRPPGTQGEYIATPGAPRIVSQTDRRPMNAGELGPDRLDHHGGLGEFVLLINAYHIPARKGQGGGG